MIDPIAHIVAYPDLSDEEMGELRRAVADDPVLAALLACRKRLRDDVLGVANSRLLTVFSLYRSGRGGDLSADEIELAAEHAERLEKALLEHPGFEIACADIADAADAFSAMWDEQLEMEAPPGVRHREDRPAAAEPRLRTDRPAAQQPPARAERPERRPLLDRQRPVRPPVEPPARAAERRSSIVPPRRRNAFRWAVRSAIGVAVIAFAFIVTQVIQSDVDTITVETAEGEIRVVDLGEGSRVRLLGAATLTYPDPESSIIRRAELDGRAYFEIAPENRGFIVETSTARVTVLGTTFGVDAQDDLTEVVLTEGRLTLARNEKIDDLVVLEPGQMSRVEAGRSPTQPTEVDIIRQLAWTGLFIFDSTPLSDISALLSDHFGVTVTVDESLAGERVTGTFEQTQPLRDILDIIARSVGANVQERADGGYALTHL